MLAKLISRLRPSRTKKAGSVSQSDELERANLLRIKSDTHAAIEVYKSFLKTDPYNVEALNNLGVCLSETGSNDEANVAFELAYSLDDTYIPGVANYAKTLIDRRRGVDSLPYLKQVWCCDPGFPGTYSVYAGLCLTAGDTKKARNLQLRAWLSEFESMRFANNYLFLSAYDDIDEKLLAAEHRFWAETQRPLNLASQAEKEATSEVGGKAVQAVVGSDVAPSSGKIRIGYWSPDFRNHSVRYFSRPLIENHDKSKFEIFLYHDIHSGDIQTEHFKQVADHFYDVYTLSDIELYKLIKSHQLDVFVEMAGHTSANRVAMLQERFAKVQLTALGYPPTTGVQAVDAKLLDRHVVTPQSAQYYAESPMILPNSFWCFDPMEDVQIHSEPPVDRNGYITFGCVGNIAKINDRILRCWKVILDQVAHCRFLIRSISFEDPVAESAMRERLLSAGFDLNQVDLRKPAGGSAYFSSYGEIDIILDTFPFNGGTTTCFATYMGVPVVSLMGESLISRMGFSILTNLGVPELAVSNEEEYIERSVGLANDISFLRMFRTDARRRFQESSLGNGKLFAAEFEQACIEALEKKAGTIDYVSEIPALPADEIIRRAYAVLRVGQREAAIRIVNHCLKYYPNSGNSHLFVAQQFADERRFYEARDYLLERIEGFNRAEKIASWISLTRWAILAGENSNALNAIEQLLSINPEDPFEHMQAQLYQTCLQNEKPTAAISLVSSQIKRIHVLIPCDEPLRFNAMRDQLTSRCLHPENWRITFERCDEAQRVKSYGMALDAEDIDILVISQKTVEIHNPYFFMEIENALNSCDVVGIAGATRWTRLHWRADSFEAKAAGFLVPSSEKSGEVQIQFLGQVPGKLVTDMAILDGSLLAMTPARFKGLAFDDELLGSEWMLEEDWVHSAFKLGLKLGVHRNLGAFVNPQIDQDIRIRTPGRARILDKYGFDPFSVVADDTLLVSAPVSSAAEAIKVMDAFLEALNFSLPCQQKPVHH